MTDTSLFSVFLLNNKVFLSFLSFEENSNFLISKLSPTILKKAKCGNKRKKMGCP